MSVLIVNEVGQPVPVVLTSSVPTSVSVDNGVTHPVPVSIVSGAPAPASSVIVDGFTAAAGARPLTTCGRVHNTSTAIYKGVPAAYDVCGYIQVGRNNLITQVRVEALMFTSYAGLQVPPLAKIRVRATLTQPQSATTCTTSCVVMTMIQEVGSSTPDFTQYLDVVPTSTSAGNFTVDALGVVAATPKLSGTPPAGAILTPLVLGIPGNASGQYAFSVGTDEAIDILALPPGLSYEMWVGVRSWTTNSQPMQIRIQISVDAIL